MARKSLLYAVYLTCLAFVVTILLAASDVEGKDGGEGQVRRTSRIAGRAAFNGHPICYNSNKEQVKCSKKKGVIIGVVIGTLFALLGVLYLYVMWIERRKGSSTSTEEENEPLSDGSKTLSDCEKGITDASENKNRDADDYVIRLPQHIDDQEEASVSGTSPTMTDPPNYDRPPGLTQTDTPSTKL